ncbi:MAG: hypothetical protein Fur0020_02590 [Thermodesulfovibrionia bacterium]
MSTAIQAFLLFIIPWLSPTVSFAIDAQVIVNQMERRFNEINDIKGRFSQRSFLKDLDRREDYSGIFFIKKPSSIRWEYSRPRDEEVIINGDKIWVYKRSEGQVLKGRFERGGYNHLPITLLQDIGNLKRDFYIKALDEKTLELTPRGQMGVIKGIELVTDEIFPIKEFTITDTYENRITIELKGVEVNTNLRESLFIFKMPPDVEVFELNQ